MSFKLTWRTHIIINLIGTAMIVVLFPMVNYIIEQYIYYVFNITKSSNLLMYLIIIILLLVPVTIVHESIHGIAHIYFGGKVKFGFKWIYAYTEETSGRPIGAEAFCIVLLAPAAAITVMTFLLPV
ncbi:MAG: metalloprotease family protein [Bacillota bacterium]|nr:metalloprotease family protein [Bacillota bacterium]